MELPHIGKHCAECNLLDMLPITCKACNKVFCKEHFEYSKHSCTKVGQLDKRVPVCPLCNKPVPILPGQTPDEVVSRHIASGCNTKSTKTAFRCSFGKCKKKEWIEVKCEKCQMNFCLLHRHPQDHNCTGKKQTTSYHDQKMKDRWAKITATKSSQLARQSSNINRSRPQQTTLNQTGAELNRLREQRQNQQNIGRSRNMTEDEQLAYALQLSLNDTQAPMTQEEQDKMMAEQLQNEENERRMAARRRDQQNRENPQQSSCEVM